MTRWFYGLMILYLAAVAVADEPLPSWNDTPHKQQIVEFVSRVTTKDSKGFAPPAERIAVFDNDGTLWCEQPVYVQAAFIVDRVKMLAAEHPEWKGKDPFRALLAGDLKKVAASGEAGLAALVGATHGNITTEEFADLTRDWLKTARHPKFKRPYTELTYQPMVELLAYLRANEFKTYIVSGGGVDFMRVFAEQAYGIPPEQVIGISGKLKYELRDGKPVIVKQSEVENIDDKAGKPLNIQKIIGRRPILAVGNSDGDFEMLQWTTAGSGPRLGVLIHHDDAQREYAYDRESHVGKLVRGLDEAEQNGWMVVSMQNDWQAVFVESK